VNHVIRIFGLSKKGCNQDLDEAMRRSTAKWKVAVGHHTMRSVSDHGDTAELLQLLLPVLKVTGSTFTLQEAAGHIIDSNFQTAPHQQLILCDYLFHAYVLYVCSGQWHRLLHQRARPLPGAHQQPGQVSVRYSL
jgi:hypothetical protein